MKINSVGIDAYRQLSDNSQVNRRNQAENTENSKKTGQVEIPIQENRISSKVGVKLQQGNFLDRLTTEEKQALEMLFSKYGVDGSKSTDSAPKTGILVDFKA
jgi:hypothetical protein